MFGDVFAGAWCRWCRTSKGCSLCLQGVIPESPGMRLLLSCSPVACPTPPNPGGAAPTGFSSYPKHQLPEAKLISAALASSNRESRAHAELRDSPAAASSASLWVQQSQQGSNAHRNRLGRAINWAKVQTFWAGNMNMQPSETEKCWMWGNHAQLNNSKRKMPLHCHACDSIQKKRNGERLIINSLLAWSYSPVLGLQYAKILTRKSQRNKTYSLGKPHM